MSRTRMAAAALGVLALLSTSACGSDESPSADPSGSGTGSGTKISAIFSGPTNDADYNALGLAALDAAKGKGAQTTYTEKVAVTDVEARLNEAVADGNSVIWTHGSQFYDATAKVAAANPTINFIAEFDGTPPDQPANVWIIDRQFHLGFYAVGAFTAALSKTGKVGYVGGLSLPFSYAEVHAMQQAFADGGNKATLLPVWTGDFNDAAKAQQFTTQLLGEGADVIVGSLNLGATGTFQAFEGKPADAGWVTAKYTDKSASAGSHYAASLIYDFTGPLGEILAKIASGTTTGYYPLTFDTGITLKVADGVPDNAKKAADDAMAAVKSGTVTVKLDTSKVG